MNIEQKILYYKKNKQCETFHKLKIAVNGICKIIKPIFPNIEPLKYFNYFIENIDFDKIDKHDKKKRPTKEEMLKYCKALYYGLGMMLTSDVDDILFDYQSNILHLNKKQIIETHKEIIRFIGLLKKQSLIFGEEKNLEFSARINLTLLYEELCNEIKNGKWLTPIDYNKLIGQFNVTMMNSLLVSYEIISKNFIDLLVIKEKEVDDDEKSTLTGFQSTLTLPQIETLFEQLKGSYIDENTNPDHFKAIFKNEPLPNDFEPVKWIDKSRTRHENNIQTLYELLYLLKEYNYLDKTNFDTTATNENNLYRKIENFFAGFQNISVKNPCKIMQDTTRKNKLKEIVLSLPS